MPDKDKDDPLPHPNQRVPLAYENKKFLNGPDGRILRILAEYQEHYNTPARTRESASASPTLNTGLPASRQGTSTLARSAENLS